MPLYISSCPMDIHNKLPPPLGHRTKHDCPGNLRHDTPRRSHTTTPTFTSTSTEITTTTTTTKSSTKFSQKNASLNANFPSFNSSTFTSSTFHGPLLDKGTQCAPGSWKERCHRSQRPVVRRFLRRYSGVITGLCLTLFEKSSKGFQDMITNLK